MSVLAFEQLAVHYGERSALAPFSDRIETGEWVGLVGPNGAGKSSLLRAVAGLVSYDGVARVDGSDLARLRDRERAGLIAYVPQDPLIPNDMTAFEYVLLGRSPYIGYFGGPSANDRAVVDDVLERLRLSDFAPRLLGALSGG